MIQFLDVHKINQRFENDFQQALKNSLSSSNYILGSNVSNFESEFAAYCGSKYCVGVANGLDALTLILKGYIHLGKLAEGDKVMVPANTFVATILSVMHAGLEPVFVEPNEKTFNLDYDNVKKTFNEEIKAIIMVHLYGQLADVKALKRFSKSNNLLLIADAAQAHGAKHNQTRAGSFADAAAFSFYPSKNLGALGDGGAITTSDVKLYETIRLLRNYGSSEKYKNEVIGYNSRLDDIQAAFLRIKLKELDKDNEKRRTIAKRYLSEVHNSKVEMPFYDGSENHVFYAFVVKVEDRTGFMNFLETKGVSTLIHYPIPPHKQKALQRFSNLNLPITEEIHKSVVSLPISPVMTSEDVDTVIAVLNAY
ncbi:DegT/DnrJ/EryC1/StrS family aminotransferase [uncultured Winogradskyella sp.]|uniref:DegT/DnrJ/EryC1/StrS family aminotransferase n=1 Tax=uncultured Winogradskyella sp. TaxID=395353 RepID=UPI00351191E3